MKRKFQKFNLLESKHQTVKKISSCSTCDKVSSRSNRQRDRQSRQTDRQTDSQDRQTQRESCEEKALAVQLVSK